MARLVPDGDSPALAKFYETLDIKVQIRILKSLALLASNLLYTYNENKTLSSSEPNGLPHRFGFLIFERLRIPLPICHLVLGCFFNVIFWMGYPRETGSTNLPCILPPRGC